MDIGTEYMVEHGHDAYGRQNRLIGKPHAANRLSSVFEALSPSPVLTSQGSRAQRVSGQTLPPYASPVYVSVTSDTSVFRNVDGLC